MTDPFEHLIRSTLTDLAQEAPIVHDQLNRAERRVRHRRRATVTLGAVGTLAAILIATPLALAATGSDQPRPAAPSPAGPAVQPSPPTPGPSGPSVVPSQPGLPSPVQPTVKPSPLGPPGVPGRPDDAGPPGVPGRPGEPGVPGGAPGVPGVPSPSGPTVKPTPTT